MIARWPRYSNGVIVAIMKRIWIIVTVVVLIGVSVGGFLIYQNNQAVEAAKPKCDNPTVKGNISFRTGEKIYHNPGDKSYDKTLITPATGEKMFCSEQDARDAGWRHAQTN